MKLNSMKKTTALSNNICEFCHKTFIRDSTLLRHICETKRRWQERENRGNQIGFQAWLQFFLKNSRKKKLEYYDFITSAYYTAFIKFGNYCLETQVLNVNRYVDYLLKEKISIDNWCRDSNYTKFIIDYLKIEDPLDAVARSIETTIVLAQQDNILTKDIFNYGNTNKICFEITKGKISPWILYQSQSGLKFLEKLDITQQKMILEYISPEQWALKFHKHKHIIQEIRELLNAGGY
jgi:hypothetical protein